MSTSQSTTLAAPAQARPAVPRRSAQVYRARRTAVATLAVGAILSVAAAFGSIWLVRAGIAIALVAGAIAVTLLVREHNRTTARHRAELTESTRRSVEAMREERVREREVLDVIDIRTDALKQRMSALRGELAESRRRLQLAETTLAETTTTLQERTELLQLRDQTITELRGQVARLENELAVLHTAHDEDDAELLALPRRVDRVPELEAKQA